MFFIYSHKRETPDILFFIFIPCPPRPVSMTRGKIKNSNFSVFLSAENKFAEEFRLMKIRNVTLYLIPYDKMRTLSLVSALLKIARKNIMKFLRVFQNKRKRNCQFRCPTVGFYLCLYIKYIKSKVASEPISPFLAVSYK